MRNLVEYPITEAEVKEAMKFAVDSYETNNIGDITPWILTSILEALDSPQVMKIVLERTSVL